VEGGGTGTSISGTGLLSVAADESAVALTVRATSTVDTGKSGTAAVAVTGGSSGDAVLQTIAVTTHPAKTVYTIGEALDLTGLIVTGTYSDGTTRAETVSASDVSGYNTNATGTQTLTVTVGAKTATFTVTVNPVLAEGAVLQSIAVTTQPVKTVYTAGEALKLDGLIVTGTYSDGTTRAETWSASDVSGYNTNTTGSQTLTVTVGGKTATFTVTVNAPVVEEAVLQSIAVTSPPAKTVYTAGEPLALDGLIVTGTYSDGTTRAETWGASDVSGYNTNTAGTQILTVTVGGKTATFTVAVIPTLTGTVSINGTAVVGQTLTANTDALGGSGTLSYQWKRGNVSIGANSQTYTLTAADVGSAITVMVSRQGYEGSVTSDPTDDVALPTLTGTVSINGTTVVGQTLTANTGALGGSGTLSYQWKRENVSIGVNSQTYTLTAADTGSAITVTVSRQGYAGSVTSDPSGTVYLYENHGGNLEAVIY
jgi:hypothetical protein